MRRSHQRLAIEAMEAERERRLLLLAREDAEMLEERHVLQQQAGINLTLTLTLLGQAGINLTLTLPLIRCATRWHRSAAGVWSCCAPSRSGRS